MKSAKHGIRVLGLAVLVALGTMAFTAVGAQAQLPGQSVLGEFLVNLGSALSANVTGGQIEGESYQLVEARDMKTECGSFDITEGKINSSTDAVIQATFLECVVRNHAGEPLEGCEFKQLGAVSLAALVLPILHGGEAFLLFEPLSGGVFTTISFKANQGCVLALNNPVGGSVVAKVNALDAVTQTLVFSEANQLLTGDVLKYGALNNSSYLNGSMTFELTGSHLGQKLGIH